MSDQNSISFLRWRIPVVYATLMARLFYSLQQWAVIAILAHNDDTRALGYLGLALAVTTNTYSFFNLGLRQGLATDTKQEHKRTLYWCLRGASIFFACLSIFAFTFIMWSDVNIRNVMAAVVLLKSIESVSDILYGFMQTRDDLKSIAFSHILRAVLGGCIFTVSYLAVGELTLSVYAWALAWFIILVCFDFRVALRHGDIPRVSAFAFGFTDGFGLLNLLLKQIPIGLAAGIGTIALTSPRLVLESGGGLEAVGVFTALWTIFQAVESFIIAAMQNYLTPLARAASTGDSSLAQSLFRRILVINTAVSALMLLIISIAGSNILGFLYGDSFTRYNSIFITLGLGWSARYVCVVLWHFITAKRNFWIQATLNGVSSIVTLISCAVAISLIDALWGAALGFTIGQSFAMCVTITVLYLKG